MAGKAIAEMTDRELRAQAVSAKQRRRAFYKLLAKKVVNCPEPSPLGTVCGRAFILLSRGGRLHPRQGKLGQVLPQHGIFCGFS
jgi:hypothetical protein